MIPILVYHDISSTGGIKPADFEAQMFFLRKKGYSFLFASELSDYLKTEKINFRTIMITFDDGYFNTYSYAFPILKKYNIKATVFIITSRIEKNENEALSGRESHIRFLRYKDKKSGFLSVSNILEMQSSGLVDFQSHSHHHLLHFASDSVASFYHPDKYHHWSLYYAADNAPSTGLPLYPLSSTLASLKYHPDPALSHDMVRYTSRLSQQELSEKRWHRTEKLLSKRISFLIKSNNYSKGYFESENDAYKIVLEDLLTSRKIIRDLTSKNPECLAWPWGISSDFARKAAKEAGFTITFSLDKVKQTEPGDAARFTVKSGSPEWLIRKLSSFSGGLVPTLCSYVKKKEKRFWNPQK